jgi:hypothetical protein
MVFGRRSPRLPLDRDGRYRIAAGEPLPRLIVVCVADEGNWGDVGGLHVVEVITPGESAEVPTASIELTWKGPAPIAPVEVIYQLPMESLRHRLGNFHMGSRCRWGGESPLQLEGVHVQVRALQIAGRTIPLDLRSGELKRIEVDLQRLTAPAGR